MAGKPPASEHGLPVPPVRRAQRARDQRRRVPAPPPAEEDEHSGDGEQPHAQHAPTAAGCAGAGISGWGARGRVVAHTTNAAAA